MTPAGPARDDDRLRSAVAALPYVNVIAVFGSCANGRFRIDSDLDVAVRLDEPTAARRRTVEVAVMRASPVNTDVVFLNDAPP